MTGDSANSRIFIFCVSRGLGAINDRNMWHKSLPILHYHISESFNTSKLISAPLSSARGATGVPPHFPIHLLIISFYLDFDPGLQWETKVGRCTSLVRNRLSVVWAACQMFWERDYAYSTFLSYFSFMAC